MDEKWTFVESCEENYPAEVCKSRNVPNDLLPTPLPGVRERNWSVERQWNIKNLKNDRTLEFKEIFQDNLPYYLILQRSRHFK